MSQESNREILGNDIMESWKRIIVKRNEEIENGTYEPCCDENNPCVCNTFSPYMFTPEEYKDFGEEQKRIEKMNRVSDYIKLYSNNQSWKRKIRNIYLKYKFRFEDFINRLKN